MSLFELSIIVIMLGGITFSQYKTKKGINIYLFMVMVALILQSGLRDLSEGNDTATYYAWFEQIKTNPWDMIFAKFKDFTNQYDNRDPGFSVIVKIFQLFSLEFRVFLIFTATLFVFSYLQILRNIRINYRYIVLSLLFYQLLIAPFANTAIRQIIAMSLCNFSIVLCQKSIKKGLLIVTLASLIHSTALIYLPFLLISKFLKPNRIIILFTIAIFIITMIFGTYIVASIGTNSIFEKYAIDSINNQGTPIFTLIIVILSMIGLFKYNTIYNYNSYGPYLLYGTIFAFILTPLSWIDSNFIRLPFYFIIFIIPTFCISLRKLVNVNTEIIIEYSSIICILFYIILKS